MTKQPDGSFAIPKSNEQPIDMSLSDHERIQRSAFYRKIEMMKKENSNIMECSKCLLIFSDIIIYRIHMTMHGNPLPYQCTMCRRQYTDRRQFLQHTVKYQHSLIPDGVVLPPDIEYESGLPDLSQFVASHEFDLFNNSTK